MRYLVKDYMDGRTERYSKTRRTRGAPGPGAQVLSVPAPQHRYNKLQGQGCWELYDDVEILVILEHPTQDVLVALRDTKFILHEDGICLPCQVQDITKRKTPFPLENQRFTAQVLIKELARARGRKTLQFTAAFNGVRVELQEN